MDVQGIPNTQAVTVPGSAESTKSAQQRRIFLAITRPRRQPLATKLPATTTRLPIIQHDVSLRRLAEERIHVLQRAAARLGVEQPDDLHTRARLALVQLAF